MTKRPKRKRELAPTAAPTGISVRLPLPPELVAAIHEHTENAIAIRELLRRADASFVDWQDALRRAAEAIQRDVPKVRAALRRRSR